MLNYIYNKYQIPSMYPQSDSNTENKPMDLDESFEGLIPTDLKKSISLDGQSWIFYEKQSLEISQPSLHKIQQEKSHEAQQTLHNENPQTTEQKKPKSSKKKIQEDYEPSQKFKIIKKNAKKYGKKAPDYKKNICGYITKKIVKQSLGKQYRSGLQQICLSFQVDCHYYQKTFKNFDNITGPTHLYNLVNPKLRGLSSEDQVKQVKIKRIFRIFFVWFLRHRYIRYIIAQGKMERKDVYIRYKNRQLLHLITQQSQISEIAIQEHVRTFHQIFSAENKVQVAKEASATVQSIYAVFVKQNMIQRNDQQGKHSYQRGKMNSRNEEFERNDEYLKKTDEQFKRTDEEFQNLIKQKYSPVSKTLSFEQIAESCFNFGQFHDPI